MKRIKQLPALLANQIAAGEVVERPASVLKELMENSIDAGSTEIEVRLGRGGIARIEVQDNGVGIVKDDLPLTILQHATSKIISAEDLENVGTLGFRGEALASIASVSQLSLQSCAQGAGHGWCLEGEIKPVGHPVGTTVTVKELFYNTPARKKFLRTEKTEYLHCLEIFYRLSLSHFNVGFKLTHNASLVKQFSRAVQQEQKNHRVGKVLGKAFVQSARVVEAHGNGLRLWGWLGEPAQAKAQTGSQYVFVNSRLIKDKIVTHAIRQGYQGLCELGHYPSYVVYLELPFNEVDVNVHPTKHEVRFRHTRVVHDFLSSSVQSALTDATLETVAPKYSTLSFKHSRFEQCVPEELEAPQSEIQFWSVNRFVFVEHKKGVLIVDSRVVQQDKLFKVFLKQDQDGALKVRPLIIPKSVIVGPVAEQLETHQERLKAFGFHMSAIGSEAVLVRSVPQELGSCPLDTILPELLRHVVAGSAKEKVFGVMAEQIATVKTLTKEDVVMVLREYEVNTSPPQGVRLMSYKKLEKFLAS